MAKKRKTDPFAIDPTGKTVTMQDVEKGLSRSGVTLGSGQRINMPVVPDNYQKGEGVAVMHSDLMQPSLRRGRLGFAVAAANEGINVPTADAKHPYAGQSGAQEGMVQLGDLQAVPQGTSAADKARAGRVEARNLMVEGFGAGNVVPASGYRSVLQGEGMQRYADESQQTVTRLGGITGMPVRSSTAARGAGGASKLLMHVRPRIKTVEFGKKAVPEPVIGEYRSLVDRVTPEIEAETGQAMQITYTPEQMKEMSAVDFHSARAKIQQEVTKDVGSRLTGDEKDVWDWIRTGKMPPGMKGRFAQDKKGNFRAVHPLSPAAGKKGAAPTKPKGWGQMPRDRFATADKVLGEGKANQTQVRKHYDSYTAAPPEIKQRLLASSENLRQAEALVQGGMPLDEALAMAYKVSAKAGEKIGSLNSHAERARAFIHGEHDPEDPDRWKTNPWHTGLGLEDEYTPEAGQKAFDAVYDRIYQSMKLAGRENDVARAVDYAVNTPFPDTMDAVALDRLKVAWAKKKATLPVQARPGDMTAAKLDEQHEAEIRERTGGKTDFLAPLPAKAPKPEAEGAGLEGLMNGTVTPTAENAQGLLDDIKQRHKAGEITEEQARQLNPIIRQLKTMGAN